MRMNSRPTTYSRMLCPPASTLLTPGEAIQRLGHFVFFWINFLLTFSFSPPFQVLRPPAPARHQLPQEEVRPHQPAAPQEEVEVRRKPRDEREGGGGAGALVRPPPLPFSFLFPASPFPRVLCFYHVSHVCDAFYPFCLGGRGGGGGGRRVSFRVNPSFSSPPLPKQRQHRETATAWMDYTPNAPTGDT